MQIEIRTCTSAQARARREIERPRARVNPVLERYVHTADNIEIYANIQERPSAQLSRYIRARNATVPSLALFSRRFLTTSDIARRARWAQLRCNRDTRIAAKPRSGRCRMHPMQAHRTIVCSRAAITRALAPRYDYVSKIQRRREVTRKKQSLPAIKPELRDVRCIRMFYTCY